MSSFLSGLLPVWAPLCGACLGATSARDAPLTPHRRCRSSPFLQPTHQPTTPPRPRTSGYNSRMALYVLDEFLNSFGGSRIKLATIGFGTNDAAVREGK